jgi:hypothetical protein
LHTRCLRGWPVPFSRRYSLSIAIKQDLNSVFCSCHILNSTNKFTKT